MPKPALDQIQEYRGVRDLVCAKMLTDGSTGVTYDNVFALAGIAELQRTTETSSEAHYYDNVPAIVINSGGKDTVTITASAIPFDALAKITGQNYDSSKGMFIEGERTNDYYAIGYVTKMVDGTEIFVWRLKGTFSIPDSDHKTEDEGTDAAGQTIVFTGINTLHKFTGNNNKTAKAINVNTKLNPVNEDTFFSTVQTPDTVTASYTLTITQATDTTVTVTRGGTALASGAGLAAGDVLTISVTGGTITVNGTAFTSGNTHTVSGNVTVVSTKSL